MAFTMQFDNYVLKADPIYGGLSDQHFGFHLAHYKKGQHEFEEWLREATSHGSSKLSLNYLSNMADRLVAKEVRVPDRALYNLHRWLQGRSICLCSLLLKGKADDGHVFPITVALDLIRILEPENIDEIIARCTPSNMRTLIAQHGSEEAKAIFAPRCHRSPFQTHRAQSPPRAFNSDSDDQSSVSEQEDKRRRMSGGSWRQTSGSSSRSSSVLSFDGSQSSRSSRSTSFTSSGSWRSSSSPSPPPSSRKSLLVSTPPTAALDGEKSVLMKRDWRFRSKHA